MMELNPNGVLSDASVVKSRNQNGSCSSSNGASVLPLKWKPRRVSAVRDFPQGCGPVLEPVNMGSQEAARIQVESSSHDVLNSTEEGKVSKELQNGDTQETSKDEIPDPVNAVIEVDNVKLSSPTLSSPTHKIDNGGDVIKKSTRKRIFPQRRVSAVRDFPPFCGLNAPEPTEEERIRINGKKTLQIEDKSSGRNAFAQESNGSVKDDSLQKTQSDETNESPIENQDQKEKPQKFKHDLEPDTTSQIINKVCQELVVYTHDNDQNKRSSIDGYDSDSEEENIKNQETQETIVIPIQENIKSGHNWGFRKEDRSLVLGLMASSLCNPIPVSSKKPKKSIKRKPKHQEPKHEEKDKGKAPPCTGTLDIVIRNDQDSIQETEEHQEQDFPISQGTKDIDVALPPFGPRSSNDARNKIRESLRLFQGLCRKLLQGEESKTREGEEESKPIRRVDLAARAILLQRGRAPDRGKKTWGSVPGVEVGDEFQYRAELALVGLHWILQGGIDYVKKGKEPVGISVVASGGYDNEVDKPDCLIYSGAGGIGKDKQHEDQKLERGNIALKNSIESKIPVRVIRGYKGKSTSSSTESLESSSKSRILTTYIYDGLYTVEKYWQETGPHKNLVFKFELKRIPGQPELALREVKSKKFKTREGLCVPDITNGQERIRIPAYNTLDDEKPPVFTYITKRISPETYCRPVPPKGCDCTGRCTGKKCACAAKNSGEIPYNHNGAIVEAKPLVYECGPACKCPPSCYNRVTQNGMKTQLEIFKTETRGWGVRSLSSISSGSFICEYVGELLEDTEAEKRTGNDEYLFDIGQNYTDCCGDTGTNTDCTDNTGGFTIDAANYGNVGRFINHSCTPNLYAQNVLYDEEDKRMPHIMFFAAENIPPLQELTYHYNYAVDTVLDSEGNIKVKKCFCGSSECTGRLY